MSFARSSDQIDITEKRLLNPGALLPASATISDKPLILTRLIAFEDVCYF